MYLMSTLSSSAMVYHWTVLGFRVNPNPVQLILFIRDFESIQ